MDFTIAGLQEAQRGNLLLMAAMKPNGAFDDAVRIGTIAAHRYAVIETHVDTGALKAAHRIKHSYLMGTVYLDQGARNPRTRELVSQYGPIEESRGGEHAFYQIVQDRYGNRISQQSIAAFISRLP